MQQPLFCFSDADLKKARVELNHLGLPRPMTGAFASVYRLSNVSGTWAVRCFLEQRDDMKERYESIAEAVNTSDSDLFAHFEYLERGIKIRSDWYPILKMEWIEGDSLDRYLDRHVKNRSRVVALHKQFRDMVARLKSSGIAHGDLQHGNILVNENNLRLIDYDGMYVSALAGRQSHELGHRNFQHPERTNELFFADLDNFSIWTIDLSLKALVIDPELWREFGGGDDCLLFRHKDLKEPDESPLFKALLAHESSDLRQSARLFREVVCLNPFKIPDYQTDASAINLLINEQSDLLIKARERAEYGEPEQTTSVELKETGASFDDYDQWLASLGSSGDRRNKKLESIGAGLYARARKVLRYAAAAIAPAVWARSMMDEGNCDFDEGHYVEAVKSYSEALEHLKRLRTSKSLQCEVLVRLGYCHIEKDQLGTAAHYFREAQNIALKDESLGASVLQANLLLAATYFDLDQKERAFAELIRAGESNDVLAAVVRGEREGSYGRRLSLQLMMTELGHNLLVKERFDRAEHAYESAIAACHWNRDENRASETRLIIARAAAGVGAARIGSGRGDEASQLFLETYGAAPENVEVLRDLIKVELKGILRRDWRFAELMRQLAHSLQGQARGEEAQLAYTAALTVFRTVDENASLQMRIADCLLGLKKSTEAVAALRETREWQKGFAGDLAGHIAENRIDDFAHCLIVATAVYSDDQAKHRFRCLDVLVSRCPGAAELDRLLSSIENSEVSERIAYAELLIDLARDLKMAGHSLQSKLAYAAAFKAFKKAEVSSNYGTSVMECLVALGDQEMAANLLIEGGKMEEMVRLMIGVMVGQQKYENDALRDLMVRVVDNLLRRTPSAVTEEEIKQSIELLKWCAGEHSEIVSSAQARVQRWFEERELAFAHSLVEQGKFGSAANLFEKHEGPRGPNVVSVQELWIMRYLSAALIDRDRGYVTAADGYAFGCAVELLNTLHERETLKPAFALQAAELIRSARSLGAERYIEDVYALFCRAGHGFEPAVLVLRQSLKPGAAQAIEKRLNIDIDQSVHFAIENGEFKPVYNDGALPLTDKAPSHFSLSPQADGGSFRSLNRTFFLIEREDFQAALEELEGIDCERIDGTLWCEVSILRGYCHFLRQEHDHAMRFFRRAITIARSRGAQTLQYNKSALCVALLCQRTADKSRHLRRLVEPTLGQRDLFKIATYVLGKHLSESENLADVLAADLLNQAGKGENVAFESTGWRLFKAALLLFGVRNQQFRLSVIDCLDALRKHEAASSITAQYVQENGIDQAVSHLVARLARRHLRDQNFNALATLYNKAGIDFGQAMDAAWHNQLLNSVSKVLSGQAPRKSLNEVEQDLLDRHSRSKLSQSLCSEIVGAVSSALNDRSNCERIERCRNELIGIAKVLEKVSERSAAELKELLERLSLAGAGQSADSGDSDDSDERQLFLAVE